MDSLQQSGSGIGAFEKPSFDPDTFDLKRVGLHTDVVDEDRYERSIKRFRDQKIVLPTFSELANPELIDPETKSELSKIDKNSADPKNLFRVHWQNDLNGDLLFNSRGYQKNYESNIDETILINDLKFLSVEIFRV